MASLYICAIAVVLILIGLNQIVFDPVDDDISRKVLFLENSTNFPIFAHRGGAHDAPENTLVAIREAKKNGADGIEFDLSFTKDNIAVLFHDDTVERTTDGFGKLAKMTFEEVRELDAAARHIYADRFRGEKVPTLEEGIEECLKLGLKVIIDVKEYDNRAVAVVSDMFTKHKELYEQALVASFFPTFIYQLRRVDPKITTALTFRPRFISYDDIPNGRPRYKTPWKMILATVGDAVLEWSFHSFLWYVTGVSAVLIHKDYISPEYVRMWRSRGVHLIAWTPNHTLEKTYITKALNSSYITDAVA